MKVYINKVNKDGKVVGRQLVNAELISEATITVKVKLEDGNIITRKKNRDLPQENTNEK